MSELFESDAPIKLPPKTRNDYKNRDIFEMNEPKKKNKKSTSKKISKKSKGK
jgi:hypothetical protein